jgi:hypothetical protein
MGYAKPAQVDTQHGETGGSLDSRIPQNRQRKYALKTMEREESNGTE